MEMKYIYVKFMIMKRDFVGNQSLGPIRSNEPKFPNPIRNVYINMVEK